MAHIKQYLSEHKNTNTLLNDLSTHFKIVDNNHIFMLTYKTTEQNNKNKTDFIRKTRGIIVDKYTHDIVSYPIDGKVSLETFTQNVEWDDIVIEESIDGTLINLYYYQDKWNVSTNSTLDGHCFWNSKKNFKELFLETFATYDCNIQHLDTRCTYSFVLCHPEARNVSLYKKPRIYHILTRNLDTYNELNLNIGIPKPKILKLDDINHIQSHNYNDLLKYCSTLHFNFET